MPKSKHRRKPGGRTVAHPGRGRDKPPGEPDWSEVRSAILSLAAKPVDGLPLFDWAAKHEPNTPEQRPDTTTEQR